MRIQVLDEELYSEELASENGVPHTGFTWRKPGDAGVDLRSTADVMISRGETKTIGLGVAIEIPTTTVGRVVGRSSTLLAFGALTHEGVIDSGYRGEIHAIITALDNAVRITRGERICQLIIADIIPPAPGEWEIAAELSTTNRGHTGLGSTGRE